MHSVGPADGLRPRHREPEKANLASVLELLYRPHRLLDGRLRIHAVLLVEVDVVHAEARERRVASLPHEASEKLAGDRHSPVPATIHGKEERGRSKVVARRRVYRNDLESIPDMQQALILLSTSPPRGGGGAARCMRQVCRAARNPGASHIEEGARPRLVA